MTFDEETADPYWTIKDVASYTKLHPQTVYAACAYDDSDRRHLQHIRIGAGRSIRTRKEWVDAWVRTSGRPLKQRTLWDCSKGVGARGRVSVRMTGT